MPTGTALADDPPRRSSPERVASGRLRGRTLDEENICMDNLVLCPCGHSLANHDYAGCTGDRLRRCGCERDRHYALEAAVDSVRTTPVFGGGYATRSDDAA